MSELVERLRLMPKSFPGLQVCDEAAARIEALEAALRDIININHSTHYNIGKIARAALAPEQGQQMRQAKDDSEIPGTVPYEAARADRLQARIEALEAALRDVSDFWEKSFDKPYDHAVIRTVRAALAPEQEK